MSDNESNFKQFAIAYLELSNMLPENIYSTGIAHSYDDSNMFIVQATGVDLTVLLNRKKI